MYDPRKPKYKTLQEEFESMGLDADEAVEVIRATGMRENPIVRANDPRVPLMRNEDREVWQEEFVDAVVTEKRYSRAPRGAAKSKAKRNYRKVRSKERIRAKRYRKSAAGKRAKRVSKRKLSRIKPRAGYRRQTSDTDTIANIVDQIHGIAAQSAGDRTLDIIEQHVMAMDKCEWVCWELADRFDLCGESVTADSLDTLANAAHELADALVGGDATIDDLESRMQEVVSRVAEALALYDAAGDDEEEKSDDNLSESRDGLDDDLVREYIDMAGESAELPGAGRGGRNVDKIPSALTKEVKKYEKDCQRALKDWVKKNGDKMADGKDADDLYDEKGAYLVLMTLRGEGVGIWDGDWDHFFREQEVPDDLEKYLEKKLGKYSEGSGSGSLEDLFLDAAYENFGEPEEGREEHGKKLSERAMASKATRVAIRTLTMGGMRSGMSTEDAVAALRAAGMNDREIFRLMSQGGMDDTAIGKAMKLSGAAKVRQMYDDIDLVGRDVEVEEDRPIRALNTGDELPEGTYTVINQRSKYVTVAGDEGSFHVAMSEFDLGGPVYDLDKLDESTLPNGTVSMFYTVLSSYLTRYDQQVAKREAKRGSVNIYRLGHFLGAAQKAKAKAEKAGIWESDSPEDLNKFRGMVKVQFNPNFPPINKWEKALDKFIKEGKKPSLKSDVEYDDGDLEESTNFDSAKEFTDFLKRTLIPDLKRSGTVETAKDFSKCVKLIKTGKRDKAFERFLEKTLIPDLRDSGMEATADDFDEALYWMSFNEDVELGEGTPEAAAKKMVAKIGKKPGDKGYDALVKKFTNNMKKFKAKDTDGKPGEPKKKKEDLDEASGKAPKGAIISKGVYYFKDKKVAKEWAEKNGWPTDRIISYEKGWAIQSGKSGNYAGPGEKPKRWGENLDDDLEEARGSGTGSYQADKPVTTVKTLKKGQLLIGKSAKFNAVNLLKVTKVDKAGFNGIFVNPKDPTKKRMGSDKEFHVWDFEMADGEYFLVKGGPTVDMGGAQAPREVIAKVEKELKKIRGVSFAGEIDRWWEGSGSPSSLWLHFEVDMIGKEGDYNTSAGRIGKGWTLDEKPVKVKNAILKALKKLGARSIKITDYPESQGEFVPSNERGVTKARRFYDRAAFRVEFTFDDVLREWTGMDEAKTNPQLVKFGDAVKKLSKVSKVNPIADGINVVVDGEPVFVEFSKGQFWRQDFSISVPLGKDVDVAVKAFDKMLKTPFETLQKKYGTGKKESLDEGVPEKHQQNIAVKTLKMNKVGASVMGGMNHKQAVKVLRDAGWSDKKIQDVLRKAKHDAADIKKFMESLDESTGNLWMRVGDRGDYENYGNDFSAAAEYLAMRDVDEVERWVKGGFETDEFKRRNYVSLFWGDDDGNLVSDLSKSDRKKFEKALGEDLDEGMTKHWTIRFASRNELMDGIKVLESAGKKIQMGFSGATSGGGPVTGWADKKTKSISVGNESVARECSKMLKKKNVPFMLRNDSGKVVTNTIDYHPPVKGIEDDVDHGGDDLTEELKLGKTDKKVIDAFTSKKAAEGNKLTTDGKKLDGHWMGGDKIAWWKDDRIHFCDLGSRAAQVVQRAIRKMAPKNDLAEGLEEATLPWEDVELDEAKERHYIDRHNDDVFVDVEVEPADLAKKVAPLVKGADVSFSDAGVILKFGTNLQYDVRISWAFEGWAFFATKDTWKVIGKVYPGLKKPVAKPEDNMGRVLGALKPWLAKLSNVIDTLREDDETLDERQKAPAAQGFDSEGMFRKGSFKISKQWLDMLKGIPEIGDKFEKGLFTRQLDHINRLERDDLVKMFGVDNIPDAQDVIAKNGKKAFQIWMRNVGKVDAKLGKGIRSLPEMAPLWFYAVIVRITGRDMANLIIRKYFVSEPETAWMSKARVKVEDVELEEGWFDNMKISDMPRDPASTFDDKKSASLMALKVSAKGGKIEPWVFNTAKEKKRFGSMKVYKKGKDKTGNFVIFTGQHYKLDSLLQALAAASSYAGSTKLDFYLIPPMDEDVDTQDLDEAYTPGVEAAAKMLAKAVNAGDSRDTIEALTAVVNGARQMAQDNGVPRPTIQDLSKAAEKVAKYRKYGGIAHEGWGAIKMAARDIEREAKFAAKGKKKSKTLHHLVMMLYRIADALEGLDNGLGKIIQMPASDISMSAAAARQMESEDWEDEFISEEPKPERSVSHLSKSLTDLLDKLVKEPPPGEENDEDEDEDDNPDDEQDEGKVPGKDSGEIGYGGPKPGKETRPTE